MVATLKLSEEQLAAATSPTDNLLVIAPPGCGKTEVLASRAAFEIPALEKNQKILALTFTKKARTNLEERLRALISEPQVRRRVSVRNFHGFSAELVLAHGRTIGLDVNGIALPKIGTQRAAFKKAGGGREIYAAEALLSRVKRHPYTDEEVLQALREEDPDAVTRLAIAVELERQASNQLHYDDILRHAQRLLQIPAVARLYQAHYGCVIVDEFQDLSLQQLDIALRACSRKRTFAGDPFQGIFSWAGAEPERVESILRGQSGEVIRLRESYRSSPKVIDVINSIGTQLDPDSELHPSPEMIWPNGGCSAKLVFETSLQEAEFVRDLARRLLTADPSTSIGVICRSGWRRRTIDEVFASELEFSVRRWDIAIEDPEILHLIQTAVAGLPRGASVNEAREATLSTVEETDVETRSLLIDAFDSLEKSGFASASSVVRSIRNFEPGGVVGPGVHLLSAHSGKGQQFDWVFLIGMEEKHIPDSRSSGESLTEEQRVLLVMLSRARYGLVVTRSRTRDGQYGPFQIRPSRWWQDVETELNSVADLEAFVCNAEADTAGQPGGMASHTP